MLRNSAWPQVIDPNPVEELRVQRKGVVGFLVQHQKSMTASRLCVQAWVTGFQCDQGVGAAGATWVVAAAAAPNVTTQGSAGCWDERNRNAQLKSEMGRGKLGVTGSVFHAREAVKMYREMQEEGGEVSMENHLLALRACCRLGDLETGRKIHADLMQSGEQIQVFVRNSLMDMYVKCGSMVDARQVFEHMPERSVVSWNVMMLGYAKQEEGELALLMYAGMQEEGFAPNDRTFVGALKACSSLAGLEAMAEVDGRFLKVGCLAKGRAIHAQVVKEGVECNEFVGTTLVDMYAKCGSMMEARHVFVEMPHRNVVLWNAMMSGYVEKQEGEVALQLYAWMQQRGVAPNDVTFVCALKACGSLGTALEQGRAIHAQVVNAGIESDVYVSNTLVDMYVKCGSMVDAQDVFDRLAHRDVVMWNAIILGHAEKSDNESALQLYAQMQQEGVTPNDRTFVGALKACSSLAAIEDATVHDGKSVKIRCLEKGKAIHSLLRKSGCESDVFVGTTLLDMYAKCGSLADARRVFHKLPHRNVVSWTAMILGHAEKDEGEAALQLYSQMQREGVVPNHRTFVGALKACSSLVGLEDGMQVDGVKAERLKKGRAIHSEAVKAGFESDAFVGATLVDMYAKCGSMVDAQQLFDKLPHRDVVSWNAMIRGYAQKEEGEMAMKLFAQMQQDGVLPNDRTFVAALKACSSLAALEEGDGMNVKTRSLEKGRAIHSQVVRCGFESDAFVGATLVDMYAKCGSIADARHVFDKLPNLDVVSWTAMILGYAEKDEGEAALQLYVRMQQAGVAPNGRTFVGALKACSSLAAREDGEEVDGKVVKMGCLEKGRSIFSQVVKNGLEPNHFVGNTLIDMYAKCGSITDARNVFDELTDCCDVVSWNAMILGYAEKQDGDMALQLYAWMQEKGISPNDRTFVGALKACSSLAALEDGKQVDGIFLKVCSLEKVRAIHLQVVNSRFGSDVFVGTTLVDSYAKCGSMEDARHVFDELPHRDVVSWTAMISGDVEKGEGEGALQTYAQMQQEGVAPNDRTFISTLKACSSLAALEEGKQLDGTSCVTVQCLEKGRALHSQVSERGWDSDVFVGTTLVDMYVKCGSIVDARLVFDKLPHRDVVSWNAIILGYAEQGESEEAFHLFSQMQEEGLAVDSWTFVNILKACGNTAALKTGKEIHSQICRSGLQTTTTVATTLIDMYGKCGSMADAQELFDTLPTRDLVAWNALIGGYTRQGESELVLHLLDRMKHESTQPDGITLLSILMLCSHVGLLDMGQKFFEAMSKEYDITRTIEHYTCMVDLLGRAGQLEEAMAVVKKMPFQPNLVAWRTVLGACQKWNNVDVGRQAFQHAVRLDETNAAAYVLMSNIYADAQMWEDRDKIQAMRKKARAWKRPGQSWWTDVDGTVHTFVVGDTTHPRSNDIYSKLNDLVKQNEDKYLFP